MSNYIAATLRLMLPALTLLFWSLAGVADNHDDMKQKLLACAGCHEQNQYAPSIDGKPVEYLYQQLLNYREGRRVNSTMEKMLAYLSADYLYDIAVYYAALPAQDYGEGHGAIEQSPAQAAIGQAIVESGLTGPACVACHGHDLRGDGVAVPGLTGLSSNYIAAQLGAWQSNTRHARAPDCMKEVADHLTGEEINAVAQWIAGSFKGAAISATVDADIPLPCGALQ